MKSKILWTLSGILLCAIFALAWAPYFIKSYVQSHCDGVRVGNVRLGLHSLTFDNVTVNRDWLQAEIPTITVDWDRNIRLFGGTVTADLDAKKESEVSTKERGTLEGQGLYIHVQKGDVQANLVDSSFDAKEVSFGSAAVLYAGHTVQLKNGSISRDGKTLKAASLEAPFTVPFAIPKVEKDLKVEVTGLSVKIPERIVEFDSASIAPIVAVKKHSKVQVVSTAFRLELYELEVNHPWVSPDPATFPTLTIKAPKTLETIEVIFSGGAAITIEPKNYRIQGSATCNRWIEAMPTPLPKALDQALGFFDAEGKLSFEVVKDPTPQIKVSQNCRFMCTADPIRALRGGVFSYMAYDKHDQLFRREVGPVVADWVPIEALPPYVPKAFITMEDPGFESHRGIIVQALQNSLQDNLKLGKFYRGGSTISMQLAKNLWLRRHKTIGRKAQEAILTLALESCLSKNEILQLYLNVVEFGPNLYGIGPAAKHYFDKEASKLDPDEAFYLASILPQPRKAVPPGQGGLARTRSLMTTLAGRGFISDTLIPLEDQDSEGWQTE